MMLCPYFSRVSMGIIGLEDMLSGILPVGYSLLMVGPAGSGKNHLGGRILAEGVRKGELFVMRRLRLPDYHRCFQALQYEGIQLRSII